MKTWIVPLAALLLAACASTPPVTTTAAADNDKDVLCEREARTGTILPTKRCRSAEDREADRRSLENASDNSRNIRAGQTGKPGT
jgi:uncharacterized protein YcfL